MKAFAFALFFALYCCSFVDGVCHSCKPQATNKSQTVNKPQNVTLEIVLRKQWNSLTPRNLSRLKEPTPYVTIHDTSMKLACNTLAECQKTMFAMQDMNVRIEGFRDITFHFCIGGDGKVYEGMGWGVYGNQTSWFGKRTIHINFFGDYSNVYPSPKMVSAAKKLLELGVSKGHLAPDYKLKGHRQYHESHPKCPGNKLFRLMRKWKNFEPELYT